MVTSHNFLFQMTTQRRLVELGVVATQFDATAKAATPPKKSSTSSTVADPSSGELYIRNEVMIL